MLHEHRQGELAPGPCPRVVTASVDGPAADPTGWITVEGTLSDPRVRRLVVRSLRNSTRRMPRNLCRVIVDLRELDEITVDVAVLLQLERRVLAVRTVTLAAVVAPGQAVTPGAAQVLDDFPLLTTTSGRLAVVSTVMHQRRLHPLELIGA